MSYTDCPQILLLCILTLLLQLRDLFRVSLVESLHRRKGSTITGKPNMFGSQLRHHFAKARNSKREHRIPACCPSCWCTSEVSTLFSLHATSKRKRRPDCVSSCHEVPKGLFSCLQALPIFLWTSKHCNAGHSAYMDSTSCSLPLTSPSELWTSPNSVPVRPSRSALSRVPLEEHR